MVLWKNIAKFLMMQWILNLQSEPFGQNLAPLECMYKPSENYRISVQKRVEEDNGIHTHPLTL